MITRMLRTGWIAALLFPAVCAAQVWRPIGDKPATDSTWVAAIYNNSLVVCDQGDPSDPMAVVRVTRWNGTLWQDYPLLRDTGLQFAEVKQMVFTDTLIFLHGIFGWNGKEYRMMRYDKAGWDTVPELENHFKGSNPQALSMTWFKDRLFLGGFLPNSSGRNVLLEYDPVGRTVLERAEVVGVIYNLLATPNELYIGGLFDSLAGRGANNFSILGPGNSFNNPIIQQDVVDEIRLLGSDSVLLTSFKTPQRPSIYAYKAPGHYPLHTYLPVGSTIYSSATYQNRPYMFLYDTNLSVNTVMRTTDSLWNRWDFGLQLPLANDYRFFSNNSQMYLVPFKSGSGKKIYEMGNSSMITGKVYFDLDSNCDYLSPIDYPAAGLLVGVYDSTGKMLVAASASGEYAIPALPGTYTLDVFDLSGVIHNTSCNTNFTVNIPAKDTAIVLNFPLQPDLRFKDVAIDISGYTGWRSRQGFTEQYTLTATNRTFVPGQAKMILKYQPGVVFAGANEPPTTHVGNELTWDFYLQGKAIIPLKLEFTIPVTIPVGDTVRYFAQAAVNFSDRDHSDNYDTLAQRVVSAFDPNDKQCFPDGRLDISTSKIRYHIRFQNTGEDTAYRVTVVDTVDNSLPLTKVKIRSASHPYTIQVKNNTLIWTFDNILLPDSGRDLSGSQGYLNYEASLRPGIKNGDSITNKAYIFFDYQKPILTNTAVTHFGKASSIDPVAAPGRIFSLYPNPATSQLFIRYEGSKDNEAFEMYTITGQLVRSFEAGRDEIVILNVADLPCGVYVMSNRDRSISEKVILQQQ